MPSEASPHRVNGLRQTVSSHEYAEFGAAKNEEEFEMSGDTSRARKRADKVLAPPCGSCGRFTKVADRAPVCGCNDCDYCDAVRLTRYNEETARDSRDAYNTKRAKRLAITLFGFCVASDAYEAVGIDEVIHYLHDHVRNPHLVNAGEVRFYVNRLLEACR